MAGGIKKFVVGSFDDEAVLFPAVKNVRKAGYKIHDVYTPYPVHGLDHAMGLRETSIHTAGFIYAITGTTTCVEWYQLYFGTRLEIEHWRQATLCFTSLDTYYI
ncbi:MAG: quinol:electron acceptor oxidoreductase subunit ActD [Ferruginibacter sp.]